MTKRIKIEQLISTSTGVKTAERAWTVSAESRFAATRAKGSKVWTLTHRRSGLRLSSALLRRCDSLASILTVIAVWDALPIDWSYFDEMDPVTPEAGSGGWKRTPPLALVHTLRDAAHLAV